MKRLFIGNLSFETTDGDLTELFADLGCDVNEAVVIHDRETGRSKGFGFVTVRDENMTAAIDGTDGTVFMGRRLTVNEARPETRRPETKGGHSRKDHGRERGRSARAGRR